MPKFKNGDEKVLKALLKGYTEQMIEAPAMIDWNLKLLEAGTHLVKGFKIDDVRPCSEARLTIGTCMKNKTCRRMAKGWFWNRLLETFEVNLPDKTMRMQVKEEDLADMKEVVLRYDEEVATRTEAKRDE